MTSTTQKHGVDIDFHLHVFPVLHLARLSISLQHALREVDETRKMAPRLDESLKNLGLFTDIGQDIADEVDMAILSVIDLLKAHQEGPNYVAAPKVEGDA